MLQSTIDRRTSVSAACWSLLAALSLVSPARAANDAAFVDEIDRTCGPVRPVFQSSGLIDYRLRTTDKLAKLITYQLDRDHTRIAIEELNAGHVNRQVKGNLNFTLHHSPNHLQALKLLAQYDLAGGKAYGYPRTECYMSWAKQFAPDDVGVLLVGGYYFWKKNDLSRAETWWQQALKVDPNSADVNYNLGLLYAGNGRYDEAVKYAKVAYANGYPLPGLRNELEKAGRGAELR